MNESNSTVIIMPTNLPLQKSLVPAFCLWILLCASNTLCSIWIISVLTVADSMHKDVRTLVVHMTFTELFGGIGTTAAAVYHIACALTDTPETSSPFKCYFFNAANVFGEFASSALYLVLSIDRFFASVFPEHYRNRSEFLVYWAIGGCWLSATIYFLVSCFNLNPAPYIVVCLLILEATPQFFSAHNYVVTVFNTLSVSIYVWAILWLKCSLCCHGDNAELNVSDIEKRMKSKLMRALTVNAAFHAATLIFGAFGASLLILLGYYGVSLGPYFAPLFHVGSLIELPIFYIYQKKFRAVSKTLMGNIFRCNRSNIVSSFNVANNESRM